MTDHTSLIARLESAGEGSRELDFDVATASGSEVRERWAEVYANGDFGGSVKSYTTSLDAALALADRLLPGFGFFLRKDNDGCNCGLVYPEASFVTPGCGSSATPALAMSIAILKALSTASEQPK